ncbi:hypothetical protein M1563_04240 [Patescibacteria group bacterium]|nr:hypothetical protein [Patescibacteria group bacterium]
MTDGQASSKAKICQELGAETLIDDHVGNLLDCSSNGIKAVLFRRPWNKTYTDSQLKDLAIIPAQDWTEVLKLVRRIN